VTAFIYSITNKKEQVSGLWEGGCDVYPLTGSKLFVSGDTYASKQNSVISPFSHFK